MPGIVTAMNWPASKSTGRSSSISSAITSCVSARAPATTPRRARRRARAGVDRVHEARHLGGHVPRRRALAHQELTRPLEVLAARRLRPAVVDPAVDQPRLARSARAGAALVRQIDPRAQAREEDLLPGLRLELVGAVARVELHSHPERHVVTEAEQTRVQADRTLHERRVAAVQLDRVVEPADREQLGRAAVERGLEHLRARTPPRLGAAVLDVHRVHRRVARERRVVAVVLAADCRTASSCPCDHDRATPCRGGSPGCRSRSCSGNRPSQARETRCSPLRRAQGRSGRSAPRPPAALLGFVMRLLTRLQAPARACLRGTGRTPAAHARLDHSA